MIEDVELRQLFQTSSEEHIQKLESGLLHLENHPDDQDYLQEVLREVHTLKGDARMLGVKEVETLTHQIEHILGKLKEDATALQQGVSDRLYQSLDALRQLVNEAVTGEPANVNTFQILALLMGAQATALSPPQSSSEQPSAASPVVSEPAQVSQTISDQSAPETPAHGSNGEQPSESPLEHPLELVENGSSNGNSDSSAPVLLTLTKPATQRYPQPPVLPTSNYRIDTIRVETRHLDTLMTQAGELTVTKMRLDSHLTELEEIAMLCEDWSRQVHVNSFSTHTAIDNSHQGLTSGFLERLQGLVNQLKTRAGENIARLDLVARDLETNIRTLRLMPLSTIFQPLNRLVRDLSHQQGKQVNFVITGEDTKADKRILEEMKDPLLHLIRNSIDHGIESPEERQRAGKPPVATLELKGYQQGNHIFIEVSDDGRGLNIEQIKKTALDRGDWRVEELEAMTPQQLYSLIFTSGFSTRKSVTEVSGRGVGLDVVRTNVERLKGSLQVESNWGKGCCFQLQLSTTLATVPVLIVSVAGHPYGIPVEAVQTTLLVSRNEIFSLGGREAIALNHRAISIVALNELLEFPQLEFPADNQSQPCIILQVGQEQLGLIVDDLVDQQDVIFRPQSKLLKRVRNVLGATILGTGEVCIVLNPQDLIKSVQKSHVCAISPSSVRPEKLTSEQTKPNVVLLAEDSIATRTQEKRILESAGYEVVTAVDGLEAYNKLRSRAFDAVVSDVQMPNLDGLSLAARIRQHPEFNELPIILVTSLASDEDKRRGVEAGANAYITKGGFSQEALLETLRRLV